MIGGAGNDTYVVDNTADVVTEGVSAGTDLVQSSATYTLSVNVENLSLTGTAAINGTGNSAANIITGNSGNNILDGGAGIDTLIGGAGDDIYYVDTTADVVIENASEGTDLVNSSASYTLSANLENLTLTGTAANGTGNALANIITGNSAANTLDGGAGIDTLVGGAGDDIYVVDTTADVVTENASEGTDLINSSANYTLSANVENLTLTGTAAINGTGNTLANTITGNSGDNILDGGAGIDTLIGGAGNDTYIVDNTADVVTEAASAGTDLVQSSVTYALAANVENLSLTGTAAINGTGNSAANIITGNSGNNILDGGAGIDTLIGGAGDDTYVIDTATDIITELANGGTDTVLSAVSYSLGATSNLENLNLTGTAATGTGNALANIITGNSAANTLDGGAGIDTLTGGAGDDIYYVDTTADVVTENASEGTDLVNSSATYTLSANVENLTLTGSAAINGTGNALVNIITGNSGDNILDGGAGIDTLIGGVGNDTYVVDNTADVITEAASAGTDLVQSSATYTLTANLENLTLTGSAVINGTGNALDNILTGNSAANVLKGGAGNDTYFVSTGDTVTENASEGTDTVNADVTWTLITNLENLTLTGTGAINGTGNAVVNILTGNSGNNILDGGAGIDTMIGGAGNDTYVVDNTADVVTEGASAGTDLVQSSATYTLTANLENLTLTGSTAINGTGNTLDNILTGNSGINVLKGAAGNDTYFVSTGDTVTENTAEGTDTVNSDVTWTLAANIEALYLTGTSAINGTGNTTDNLIVGNSGSNTLNGLAGNDILQGAAGVDTLTDTLGNNVLDGGAGDDIITGGVGNDFIAGGVGNDTITTGQGLDVIAFNRGDGMDIVNASTVKDNTLSLGKGIKYADLLFKKSGSDLILVTGTSEQVTLKGWYLSTANHSINNLQIVIEGTTDYNAASSSVINNKKIEQFNFDGLVTKFDQALVATPSLTSWALSSSLLSFYLAGSDTAAIGGDLAYQYAKTGNLSGFSMMPAEALLASGSFGSANQALQSPAALIDASPRLI